MPRYYLRSLSIEGFRGINNQGAPLTLEFADDKVTSIFGWNGSGKSSIYEAVQFLVDGNVRKLAGMQPLEEPTKCYTNRFHKGPGAIKAEFMPDDGSGATVSIAVSCSANGDRQVTSGPADPESFLKAIRCDTLMLNYETLSRFMLDSPLERGRTLTKLLGLGDLSATRASLDALADTRAITADSDKPRLEAELKAAEQQMTSSAATALGAVNGILPVEKRMASFHKETLDAACMAELSSHPVTAGLVAGKTSDQIDPEALKERLKESEGSSQQARLGELSEEKARIDACFDLSATLLLIDELRGQLSARKDLLSRISGVDRSELYEAAEHVLKSGLWSQDKCPLCERDWAHPSGLSLPEFLASQLEINKELSDLGKAAKRTWANIRASLSRANSILKRPLDRSEAELMPSDEPPSPESLGLLSSAATTVDQTKRAALGAITNKIDALKSQIPESVFRLTETVFAFEQYKIAVRVHEAADRVVQTNRSRLADIAAWTEFVKSASSEFSACETQLGKRQTLPTCAALPA